MSLFSNIKRAFGFDDDIDNLQDDMPSSPEPVSNTNQRSHIEDKPLTASATAAPVKELDAAKVSVIFEHVVAVFNQSLPGFLQNSVDAEAQRKHLYDTLDSDIKAYLSSLDSSIENSVEQRWRAEKERLQKEMSRLESQTKELESKRADMSQKQLSSDRQKRALTERVNDLEKQIATLEAEKEQFDLENKSLVNKAKVVAVYEKENSEMREEINRLRAMALSGAAAVQSSEIPSADQPIAIDSNEVEVKELRSENETLRNEIDKLKETGEQLRAANDDLSRQLDDAKTESALLEEDLANLRVKLSAMDETNHQDIIDKAYQVEEFEGQLKEIQQQMEEFEEIKNKKDRRISELKEQLKVANATIEELNAKTSSLDTNSAINEMELTAAHDRIERLTAQVVEQNEQLASLKETLRIKDETFANSDKQLRQKIASLSDELDRANASKEQPSRLASSDLSVYRSVPNNVTDILNDTDWLDPAPAKRRQRGHRNDDSVHVPPQKNPDDPQMSLW
jgi:chromosome segregation ATPase